MPLFEIARAVSTTDQVDPDSVEFFNVHNKIADRAQLAWQPQCGLEQANLFLSASFSTTQTFVPVLMNANQAGIEITFNTTVAPGGGQTLTVIVDHFDYVTATYFPAETIGTITGTGPSVLQTAAPVPQSWRVRVVPSGAGTWTASGSYSSLAALKQSTAVVSLPLTTNAGAGAVTLDYDTGGGTQAQTIFGIALPASGGSVAGGTVTNPVRTDPTGTTAQPVSGTVTANQGTAGATGWLSQGDVAAAATDAGNPVKIGGRASLNEPTEVNDDQRVGAWFDRRGRLVIKQSHANPEAPTRVILTSTGEQTLVAAPGAGLSVYVTDITGSNEHTQLTRVDLKEGAGGTVRYSYVMAARGGGFAHSLKGDWRLPANTALVVQQTVMGTAYVTVNYYVE